MEDSIFRPSSSAFRPSSPLSVNRLAVKVVADEPGWLYCATLITRHGRPR